MDESFEFEEKEFENEIDNEKHWKSLGIASAVISVICFLIVMAIILLSPAQYSDQNLTPYSLEEVIDQQIVRGHHFNGTWISDHEFIYQTVDKNIALYDCLRGSHTPITHNLNTTNRQIVSFEMSPMRTFLLIATAEPPNKHPMSTIDCDAPLEYFLYDLRNGNILNLLEELRARIERGDSNEKDIPAKANIWRKSVESMTQQCTIQSAQWAPRGNELFLTAGNDIYRLKLDASNGVGFERLTIDGSEEAGVLNGFNDPTYREFIFTKRTSLWWSQNGSRQYLCYLKLNNSAVPLSSIFIYPDGASQSLRHFRYPVIDDVIGEASLWVMELKGQHNSSSAVPIGKPSKLDSREHYLTYVSWTPNNELLVIWTLRKQRRSVVGLCSAEANWRCTELLTLRNWLPLKQLPRSIIAANRRQKANQSTEYFLCCQIPENAEKAFHQLYSLNPTTRTITSYLNTAELDQDESLYYVVTQLLAYNEISDLIFFVAQSLNRSTEGVSEQDMRPNVFVLSLTYGTVQCVSCRLVTCHRTKNSSPTGLCLDVRNSSRSISTDSDEESCLFQSGHFSPHKARFAVITCLVGVVPRVYLVHFANLNRPSEDSHLDIVQNITLLEDNAELEQRIASKLIPNVQSFIISREHDTGLKYLRLKILTPHDFNSEHRSKYSLLFQFGPPRMAKSSEWKAGEYSTEEFLDSGWAIHMVTKHQFVYAWIDGHLTEDFNHSRREQTLNQLADDYSAALDFVKSNMTFVDVDHTCLLGRNVGATLVLIALSSVSWTRCGVAISPVIEWRFINTLIAEQYLDWERFDTNDLSYLLKINLNHSALNGKSMFLIHGTSNELVPIFHTMQLLKGLTLEELRQHRKRLSSADRGGESSERTNQHLVEPLINQGNSFEALPKHFYRKIESFLFTHSKSLH